MQPIRTQPAGPRAFRLYSMVRETYHQALSERALLVYEALTYYVHPKTLAGTIPLKLLTQTTHYTLSTVRRALAELAQHGFIAITPQWDAFGCVPQANLYTLYRKPMPTQVRRPVVPRRKLTLVREQLAQGWTPVRAQTARQRCADYAPLDTAARGGARTKPMPVFD